MAVLGMAVLKIEVNATEDNGLVIAEEEPVITVTLGKTGGGNEMHPSVVLTSPMLTATNLPATNNSKKIK